MLKVGIHKPQRETVLRLGERGLGDGGVAGDGDSGVAQEGTS